MKSKAGTGFFTEEDLPDWVQLSGSQTPGRFPFTRGIHPEMYRERHWRMRQYAGFGTPEQTNERWKRLIEGGQHGVSCAFDLPTQLGIDSDRADAAEDAGRLGVAIDTREDFIALFDGIPLDETAATFNINATGPVIYALLLEAAEAQGVDPAALTGTLSNDPLIEFVARGLWRVPPEGAMRLMADTYAHSLDVSPSFYPINLRATLIYEAGGTVVHEFAYGFACAIAYLDALVERGVDMDKATACFSYLLFSDSNFLVSAASFRAARMIWAELVRDRYGVESTSGQKLRFSAVVGNFNLRAQMPELNLVRNTLGALGGALGGCQAMLVAGMDEAFEIPSEYSSMLGLYTQQVIAYEGEIDQVVDPLGGSYFIEWLTDKLKTDIEEAMVVVEEAGGAIQAIEEGIMQKEISEAAYQYQREEEDGTRKVVGVNTPGSPPLEDPDFELHEHDAKSVALKAAELRATRVRRDNDALDKELGSLRKILDGDANVIPAFRSALKAGATVGEIMEACIDRYGEHSEGGEVV